MESLHHARTTKVWTVIFETKKKKRRVVRLCFSKNTKPVYANGDAINYERNFLVYHSLVVFFHSFDGFSESMHSIVEFLVAF